MSPALAPSRTRGRCSSYPERSSKGGTVFPAVPRLGTHLRSRCAHFATASSVRMTDRFGQGAFGDVCLIGVSAGITRRESCQRREEENPQGYEVTCDKPHRDLPARRNRHSHMDAGLRPCRRSIALLGVIWQVISGSLYQIRVGRLPTRGATAPPAPGGRSLRASAIGPTTPCPATPRRRRGSGARRRTRG